MSIIKIYSSAMKHRLRNGLQYAATCQSKLSGAVSLCLGLAGACVLVTPATAENFSTRLLNINDFTYAGAFALPHEEFGESSANWAEGVIEVDGESLFLVGHSHQNAVAEFTIPPLVNSQSIADLRYSCLLYTSPSPRDRG